MIEPLHARVRVNPEEIAKRRAAHWEGLSAETVQFTGKDPFDYQFQSSVHMLVVCHRAVRIGGETSIEGLPPSALRSFGRTLCLVPASRAYNGWFLPRVLPHTTYLYLDPQRVPVDPEAGLSKIEFAPRLFFFDRAVWETALKLCALVENPSDGSRLYADSLASVLAIELRRLQNGGNTYIPRISGGLAAWQERIVRDYMNEHLADDVSLRELSELAQLSPTHFSRAFKSSFGASPQRYQLQRRVERGKLLLADPRHSLSEISQACGFVFQANFATAFRKITGTTPSQFRRSIT
jgi:AraC family transcriptional regulator